MAGKISRLSRDIRDQLHRRLDDGQTEATILPWLNSLPEVQALLQQSFQGKPIDAGNLSEYRKRGFRQWRIRQSAAEFLSEAPKGPSPIDNVSSAQVVDCLVQWISLRFAAAAQTCPPADDPQTEFREIRALLADIVALRRGELLSRRIAIDQQRLDLLHAKSQQELEQLFWEWTKRADIHATLFPHRDPDKLRREVVSILDHQLLGSRNTFPNEPPPEPDPACLV